MNAQTMTVAPDALALAATNQAILRALQGGPISGDRPVAKAAGVAPNNVTRQLKLLEGHALLAKAEEGWTLTQAGRVALDAIDLAEGRRAPPAQEGGADAGDALLIPHHQLKPNPLNPRRIDLTRPREREALDQLKASIVADLALGGPGLLQNLVVFPPDPDGVHLISAGERRWLAVGELIEEGVWPRERRLRAIQRENSPGLAAFIGLVENGQRRNLDLLDEAYAYAALCQETGWSARHAALQTGRDVKTVQQMLQVVRLATPDNLARYRDPDDRDYTWEALRRSVQQPGEDGEPAAGDGGRDPNQVDLEDALDRHSEMKEPAEAGDLSNRELLILCEIQARIFRKSMVAYGGARVWGYPPAEIEALGVNARGYVSWTGDGTTTPYSFCVYLRSKGKAALLAAGLWPEPDRIDDVLARARGLAGAWTPRPLRGGEYAIEWLRPSRPEAPTGPHVVNGVDYGNATRAAEARRALGLEPRPPANHGGGRSAAEVKAPEDLPAIERLALAELAHKIATQGEPDGWARVFRYWLHSAFVALKDKGLVDCTHSLPNGPHAKLTAAGEAYVQAHFSRLLESDVQALRAKAKVTRQGDGYAMPWLNEDQPAAGGGLPQLAATPPGEPADDFGKSNEDLDDEAAEEARLLLEDVARALDSQDDFDPLPLFRRAGISFPLGIDPGTGAIVDARGEFLCDAFLTDADEAGQGGPQYDTLRARTLLIAAGLNAMAANWQDRASPTMWRMVWRGAKDEAKEPAVPVRRSITPGHIASLEDGVSAVSIRPLLDQVYRLTPDAYRERWGLPKDYPLVAPNEMKVRSDLMKALGVDVPVAADEDELEG